MDLRIVRSWILATGLAIFAACSAYAADPDHDYSADPPLSQVTKQELKQWAGYYWEHRETGVWSSEAEAFEFTYPAEIPPGFVFFGDAFDVFEDLYQDQLQLDPWAGPYYGINDLINDDPEVYEQFKHYTMTGVLIMGAASDNQARIRHQLAALEASLFGELYEIGELQYIDEHVVVTVGLKVRPTLTSSPSGPIAEPIDPNTLPPQLRNFDYWLKQYKNKLYNVPNLYKRNKYPTPAFDCVDFADAMAEWLKKRFGLVGIEVEVIYVHWWSDVEGKKVGHAVVIVKRDGYYWVLDPLSGTLTGPFPEGTDFEQTVGPAMHPGYGIPPGTQFRYYGPYPPGYRWGNDSMPWWHSPDMREHFEQTMPPDGDGNPQKWWWYAPDDAPQIIDEIVEINEATMDSEIVNPQPQFVLLPE